MRFRAAPTLAAWAAGALGIAGFIAIFVAWRGSANTPSLALQLPYLLSGGFLGLGLVLFAVMLAHVELSRRLAMEENAALREVVASTARITATIRDERNKETNHDERDADKRRGSDPGREARGRARLPRRSRRDREG